jgi:lysophospholipase L1-like esterase
MRRSFNVLLVLLLVGASDAVACPHRGGLPDLNCDGAAKVAVVGDSVVYGRGDAAHGDQGGYVLRTAQRFSSATFYNHGVPGKEAGLLVRDLSAAFDGTGDTTLADDLKSSDVVFLDIGRNDWWTKTTPLATWRNLKRCREIIQARVLAATGHKPLVITAQMVLANRTGQGVWVKELDTIIGQKGTALAPADLRFDLVSKKLLVDAVHPSSAGYDAAAKIFIQYLRVLYPQHAAVFRKDADHDGLYDEFEQEKYGTDPVDPDTDDDGILDGLDSTPTGT